MTVMRASDPELTDHLLDSGYSRRIYAEGDSWFAAGGFLNGSLLDAISRQRHNWLIVSSAYQGDRLVEMREVAQGEYQWMLAPTDGMPEWDALLISGGGNDLLGNAVHLVDADGVMNVPLLRELKNVAEALDGMVREARKLQPDIPIFLNAYDYVHPVESDAPWIVGPFVGPAFAAVGLPRERWDWVALELVNSLHAVFLEVCGRWPDVHIVDCRGRLKQPSHAWWSPLISDWANEIHPSGRGYDKHADDWVYQIEQRLTH